jgi:hypothetical protein
MFATITCWVTEDYRLAVEDMDDKELCLEYVFDLETRRMFRIGKTQPAFMSELRHDAVARNYFDSIVDTPEKLMEFAGKNELQKIALAALLESRVRKIFLAVCAVVERNVTVECGKADPCLEEGCAFEGTDETCLNAVLLSEGKCLKACIEIWVDKFKYPENRIEVWRK